MMGLVTIIMMTIIMMMMILILGAWIKVPHIKVNLFSILQYQQLVRVHILIGESYITFIRAPCPPSKVKTLFC